MGARLLRDYAQRINLAPNFTILDRSDAEDLMGMVRHALGLAETVERVAASRCGSQLPQLQHVGMR